MAVRIAPVVFIIVPFVTLHLLLLRLAVTIHLTHHPVHHSHLTNYPMVFEALAYGAVAPVALLHHASLRPPVS